MDAQKKWAETTIFRLRLVANRDIIGQYCKPWLADIAG
jgi:hypothetical protein